MVTPFSMNTMGPLAYKKSRAAMRKALISAHMQEHSPNHWVCFVDGGLIKDDELGRFSSPLPSYTDSPQPFSLHRYPHASSTTSARASNKCDE